MKKISWEIIVAGLVFVFVALYLLEKPSTKGNNDLEMVAIPTEPPPPKRPEPIHVIDLKHLEEVTALKELEHLKELASEEHLEKIKALAHLIPQEVRDEFLTEMDKAIRELSEDEISINFESDDKLLVIKKDFDIEQGNWENTSPGVYTYLKTFDAFSIKSAAVNIPSGSITIIGTSDVKAKFTVQASGKISSAEELNSKIVTTSAFVDDEAIFNLNAEETSNIQLQATLYIPESIDLSTNMGDGHIVSTNIEGDQVYETGGGHIKLKKTKGDVIAVSGGGHISLEGAEGDVTLKTSGGHLAVKDCTGDVNLKTLGGNIDAKYIKGDVIASTQGGNIVVKLTDLMDDIVVKTSAGNIQVYIPKNSKASIEIEASGSTEVKGFDFSGTKWRKKMTGTVNGGGTDIIAYSKYGTVSIIGND